MLLDNHACLLCRQCVNSIRKFGSNKGVHDVPEFVNRKFQSKGEYVVKIYIAITCFMLWLFTVKVINQVG